MAITLNEIAENVWRQAFPRPGDETAVPKWVVLNTAKLEYAGIIAIDAMQKRMMSEFELPSELLQTAVLKVSKDDFEVKADISDLPIVRAIPNDMWWLDLRGKCEYMKTTARDAMIYDAANTPKIRAYPTRNSIVFPEGTPESEVRLYFAGFGEVNTEMQINADLAAMVRQRLDQIYLGRPQKEDLTNNSANDV